jgi:hypothetical protein
MSDETSFDLEKLALLAHLREAEDLTSTRIIPRKPGTPLPLSFTQEWVWRRCRFQPFNPFYNNASAFILEGALDEEALEKSLHEIIRRHESWRTRFMVEGSGVAQVVLADFPLKIGSLDLSRELNLENAARSLAGKIARQPFDLTGAPPLRATLLKLGNQKYALVLVAHHIIADGWSAGLFGRELSALYPAYQSGKIPARPTLPIQYGDYTLWQRQGLEGGRLAELLEWWQTRLAGVGQGTSLAGQKPRPGPPTFAGKAISLAFTRPLTDKLTRLSRQEGVTLFTLMLAAFKTRLFYYVREENIVVGTPVANRTPLETEGLLGCFVNSVVLRSDLAGNPTFRGLLQREKKVCQEAFAHQELPFIRLVEALQPGRADWPHPFFQIYFEYNNTLTRGRLQLPGLELRPLNFEPGTTRYDLNMMLEDRETGLGGWLQYATDLYEEAFMRGFALNYTKLLEQVATDPDRPLSELVYNLDPA